MYLDFFALKKFPFRITPDPSMFFPGGANGPGVVLNALVYAVTSGEGIVKVVGEVGSGKTMLCRMLEEKLPDSVEIVYLANPSLSARDIIYAIAFELDLDVDASTERLMVMHKLQDYLVRKHSEGGAVVVFIEEAQGMPIETLEEIRLLSNLETHRHKLMQIILFGQPELDRNLQGKSIRQLRERITHSFYLQPMTQEQTSDYLRYRMQAAGCPWPQIFTPKAEKLLSKASEGLTRRVNILADKSLMAAYASSSIQPGHEYGAIQQKVLPRHVKAAIRDSGYGRMHLMPWKSVAAGVALLALGGITYLGFSLYQGGQDSAPQLTQSLPSAMQAVVTAEAADLQVDATLTLDTENREIPADQLTGVPRIEAQIEEGMEEGIEEGIEASMDAGIGEVIAAQNSPGSEPLVSEETMELSSTGESGGVAPAQDEAGATQGALRQEGGQESTPVVADISNETVTEPVNGPVNAVNGTAISVGASVPAPEATLPLPQDSTDRSMPETLPETGQSVFGSIGGLVGARARISMNWLDMMSQKDSYTVQMAAFPVAEQPVLEEYLQLLALTDMIDETYLCLISGNARLSPQWLVMHGDFTGVSRARNFIEELPAYSRRYEPFVRNSGSIACLQRMP